MPELPEVETTLRGVRPYLAGQTVSGVVVRDRRLRWPVSRSLSARVGGRVILAVRRRAKYLLVDFENGSLILHLGMSGSLRVLPASEPAGPHDHFDLCLGSGLCLRLRDPRRFGCVVWSKAEVLNHRLLRHLGPEPFSDAFSGEYLRAKSRGRKGAVKNFLMDGGIVVGVGNIYASESLHLAEIHPHRASGRISTRRYQALVDAVRCVLSDAIEEGGTTLRDFTAVDGDPGYFRTRLNVYGRTGEPCSTCGKPIRRILTGQRATFYCPGCQR